MQEFYKRQEEERAALAAWLLTVKVGDEVAVFDGYRHSRRATVPTIKVVSSATPTLIRVEGFGRDREFRRKDGHERGGSDVFNRALLKAVTDEVRDLVRLHAALDGIEARVDRLMRAAWTGVDASRAEQILALLPEVKP